jgi:ubiquinone biosynthesis protein UbiJ
MADPLEALLRPVANVLNRNIAETTAARELCAKLDGRSVAVRVRDTALAMVFRFEDGAMRLSTEVDDDADVVVSGSLLTLARLAMSEDDGSGNIDGIDIFGDARSARAFQELLAVAKPDVEEELARVVGDVPAHQLGSAARALGRWARDARATLRDNIREYLQEESRDLPSRYEVERFTKAVDELRDDVARLEARLGRLESGS